MTRTLARSPHLAFSRVQKVEVFLHPTFNPNRLVLTEQPFEFARVRDVLSCP